MDSVNLSAITEEQPFCPGTESFCSEIESPDREIESLCSEIESPDCEIESLDKEIESIDSDLLRSDTNIWVHARTE